MVGSQLVESGKLDLPMAYNALHQSLIVDLHISADDYLLHYQGHVKQVSCISRDGRRVRFPTKILQPFVTRGGIHGTFAIEFDSNNKFISIKRIS